MIEPRTRRSIRTSIAIAFVSGAVLIDEIAFTRILSVVLWYHFAFLSVSLVMLGLGAPGVWLTLRGVRSSTVSRALVGAAIATPLAIAAIFEGSRRVPLLGPTIPGLGVLIHPQILLVVAAMLPPFLCLGTAICALLMTASGRDVARLYGFDLLGAAVGSALVVPAMWFVPTPSLVAGTAFLPLVALVLVANPLSRRMRSVAAAIAAVVAAALVWGAPFRLHVVKNYVEPDTLLVERWTPTARITVFSNLFFEKAGALTFGWGMGSRYVRRPLEQLWLEQDGSAGTPITKVGPEGLAALDHLDFDVTSAVYQLRRPRRVCVIGAGGGRDVLAALRAGAGSVEAVELNPAIVELLGGRFREFSGDPYHMPGVTAEVGEGRNVLTRSHGGFDVIQISMIDSWAATAAGAYALSENYLYTVEALELYLDRCAPDGVVSISRWIHAKHALEAGRLALIAAEALSRAGMSNPKDHLAVVVAENVATLLVSKRAFTGDDLARLDAVCDERGFIRHWPRSASTPEDSSVAGLLTEGPEQSTRLGLDMAPATDDRPFFFQTVRLTRSVDRSTLSSLSVNEHGVTLLRMLVPLLGAVTLALFLVPFATARWRGERAGLVRGSLYFVAIGLAFLLVELPWMQRFVLYLGHPSYATTVVLAVLLLGAGLGALVAARAPLGPPVRYGFVLPLSLLVVNSMLGPVFRASLGWPFAARVGVGILLLAPAGFLMGFPFAVGMSVFPEANRAWYWAMNGVASVLAGVLSLALAMTIGFGAVAALGGGAYLAAWALLPPTRGGSTLRG